MLTLPKGMFLWDYVQVSLVPESRQRYTEGVSLAYA